MLCLVLAACAGKKEEGWKEDKQAVMDAIVQAQTDRAKMADELHNQQEQLTKLEKQAKQQDAGLAAIQTSLEAIHSSLKELATASRRMAANNSKAQKKKPRAAKPSLVKKLDKMKTSIAQVKPPAPPPPPELTSEDEKNRYTAAYLALKSGRYDEATATFEKLLKDFPKGELSDQAYYWLGESYYAQHNLKSAIQAFSQVVTAYTDSPKHASALLRLGTAYQESGNPAKANAAFQRLIREHPDSAAAENARSLLKAQQSKQKTSR